MNEPVVHTESDVRDLVLRILGLHDRPPSELRRSDIPEWDSLKHMEIVFTLEDRYRVRFDESEFAVLTTTKAIIAALSRHLAT
jgi:acyl carrier protein